MRALGSKKPSKIPEYFTPRQVAERFQVKELTVRLWIKRGLLKAFKAGHSWRVSRMALEEFESGNSS